MPSLWHLQEAIGKALTNRSGHAAVAYTDLGPTLHPRPADLLGELSADRVRRMNAVTWAAWWDDLLTAATSLGLATAVLLKSRATYEPKLAEVLPALAANPSIPLSSGGFETLLRNQVAPVLAGRAHALANIERCASLLDLAVCRAHGVFDSPTAVAAALRKEHEAHQGWSAAPRVVADPQPPAPGMYSSLRDRDLPVTLAGARGLSATLAGVRGRR